jgi:putative radical SAM enzyme (TIGR03279 family)
MADDTQVFQGGASNTCVAQDSVGGDGNGASKTAHEAFIKSVTQGSPAEQAGLRSGMQIAEVNGEQLRDYIDWLWFTDGEKIELTLADGSQVVVKRNAGQPWGIDFDGVVFDGVKTCCNTCTFCFMTMLPKGMRPSLFLRDDDYRLSFLQGNFVTLTNTTNADIERIIAQQLSPLHVSLHAITPEVRMQLIGKRQARGMEALEQLLAANIKIQVQIVLMPGINDTDELEKTLAWIEPKENITSVGIVPYGYTQYAALQEKFTAGAAQKVLDKLAIYQERSRRATGVTRFMVSDEFYRLAYPDDFMRKLPPAEHYDGYPQFEDGIGMLRAFLDEWELHKGLFGATQKNCSSVTKNVTKSYRPFVSPDPQSYRPLILATGTAFAPVLQELIETLPQCEHVTVRAITNTFFGGNVDVAGLITASDLIEQLVDLKTADAPAACTPAGSLTSRPPADAPTGLPTDPPALRPLLVIPSVMLNENGLFLDDLAPKDVAQALNVELDVVSCNAEALIQYLNARSL